MRRSVHSPVHIWPLLLALAMLGILAWTPTRELYIAVCQAVGEWLVHRIVDSLPK
jgi:hypothetical protein